MSRIQDKQKVSSYITKYISKGIAASVKEYGAHLYYCSKGLKTGTVIYRGIQPVTVTSGWDYSGLMASVRSSGMIPWIASLMIFVLASVMCLGPL